MGSGQGFGWAGGVGVLRGDGLDSRKAPLVCFVFAGKRTIGLVHRPMRDGVGWQTAPGQCGPDVCGRFEGPALEMTLVCS